VEEVGHLAHILINVDVICSILELIAVVLDASVEKLAPLIGVKSRDELATFLLGDKVIEYVEAWNGASVGDPSVWEIDN